MAKGFLSLPRSNAHSMFSIPFSLYIPESRQYSCFSHAIAISKGKFLQSLTPKRTKQPSTRRKVVQPQTDEPAGEVDLGVDNEDTEEQIEALVMEVEATLEDMPSDSPVVKLAASLLLKVRGFVAKVRYSIQRCLSDSI
jgi:hypothetical protein